MEIGVGSHVAGYGMIFKIADIFHGVQGVSAAILLENIEEDNDWQFQWLPMKDFVHNFKAVER
jgi:hypothetical protein